MKNKTPLSAFVAASLGKEQPRRTPQRSFKSQYAEKLKDPRWQRKRLTILARDEFTCRDCGSEDKTLHVHHCLYRNNLDPWDYRDEELRTLCEECHQKRASIEHDVKLEFARLLALMDQDQISGLMPEILAMKEFGGPECLTLCEASYIGELKKRIAELRESK